MKAHGQQLNIPLHKCGSHIDDEVPRSPSKAEEAVSEPPNPKGLPDQCVELGVWGLGWDKALDRKCCLAPPLHICLQAVIWTCTWQR